MLCKKELHFSQGFGILTELLDVLHEFGDLLLGLEHEPLHPFGRADRVQAVGGQRGVQFHVEAEIARGGSLRCWSIRAERWL